MVGICNCCRMQGVQVPLECRTVVKSVETKTKDTNLIKAAGRSRSESLREGLADIKRVWETLETSSQAGCLKTEVGAEKATIRPCRQGKHLFGEQPCNRGEASFTSIRKATCVGGGRGRVRKWVLKKLSY